MVPRTSLSVGLPRLRCAVALAVLIACSDATAPISTPESAPAVVPVSPSALGRATCVVNVTTATLSCAGASPSSASRASRAGSDALQAASAASTGAVALGVANVAYANDVLSFSATITNLISQPLGTTDGVA